ncbi:MAG: hypothetical protein HYY26_07645 [Acidobacteria bacterium]|nr:hypothetical protein [Acidobacteriota bacterium]
MARIQRQELKHDEFIDTFDEFLLYLEDHWRTLVLLGASVLAAAGSLGGFYWYSERQEGRGEAALVEALFTFEAPVQAGLPPLPGSTQKIFSSERAKYEAAREEFARVRGDYPRTRAALMAKHYEAFCQFQLGEREAAVAALEELSRAADPNVAAMARYHLAGFYQAMGRRAEAEKLYRELAAHPAATVPRELALLELANLVAESNPAEARQLYLQVQQELPDTAVAAEASRRLDRLPAAPAAAQP